MVLCCRRMNSLRGDEIFAPLLAVWWGCFCSPVWRARRSRLYNQESAGANVALIGEKEHGRYAIDE